MNKFESIGWAVEATRRTWNAMVASLAGRLGELMTMSIRTVGTCGDCGGPVLVRLYPPTPQCAQCNATPAAQHGPVMPMKKKKNVR